MKILRFGLALIVAATLIALLPATLAFAYDGDAGHLTGGTATTGELYVGFAATGHYTLGFLAGSFPGGIHATPPPYTVSPNSTDWYHTPTVTGNFTTSMSPLGPLTDLIEEAASAGNTPSQLPFTIISTFAIIAASLAASWLWRLTSSSGSLFVKGIVILAVVGIFVALRWWDFWMLIIFVILFTSFGMMSRHQSWQSG